MSDTAHFPDTLSYIGSFEAALDSRTFLSYRDIVSSP